MNQQLTALISPRDQRTATIDHTHSADATKQPTVLTNGVRLALGDYLGRFPATEFVTASSQESISASLSRATDRSSALDFCLMLFDSTLSQQLKGRAAQELDDLLLSEDNRNYVLDILLSQPLPKDADFATAKLVTCRGTESHCTVLLLEETRSRADFAYKAWLSIRKHAMVSQIGEYRVRANLILSGIIRRAVIELTTKHRLRELCGALIMETQSHLDPRVIWAFLNAYKQDLPEGSPAANKTVVTMTPVGKGRDGNTVARASSHSRIPRRSATDEQDRALAEVDTITRLFLDGRDSHARQYLSQLIERQSIASDQSHLVKSLCNIASRCTTGGRYDVAVECLLTAVKYEHGVDSRLFVQMGNLFKDLRRFDEATNSFRKANSFAENSAERDLINRELARLLVTQGDYKEALEAFRRLSDIDIAPESRTSMATLHRKMGDLSAARSIYSDVWHTTRSHQSFAGLAEVNRQSGRLGKAVRKYAFLISQTEIDDRSAKVYKIAMSSVLSTWGKFKSARRILEPLSTTYQYDASIQLAMAKVCRLLGDFDVADELYRSSRSRLHEYDQLALQLYETAVMNDAVSDTSITLPKVLPEFQALSHCNALLRRIITGDLAGLREMPTPKAAPFRIHSDFDSVLHYHACSRTGLGMGPLERLSVNRIRKRGLDVLKSAVRSIDRGDFESAIRFEREMCLRVA